MALRKMAIPFKNFLKNTIISSSQMNDNLSEIEYCHNNLHEEVNTVKSTTYTKTESDKLLNNLDTKLVTTKGNLETSILNNVNTLNSKIDTTKNELNSTINSVNTTLDSKINSVNTTLDSKINANKNELDSKINANHKDAKSYSDSNKASLIDNAPVNLNTLNKISNAIGNDANFSINTKNSIDKKANSNDVYTKNEVYTKKEIDLKMDNIETVTRSSGISPSCVKIVTPGEWIEEDGVYFVNLKHNLLASRVLVSMIDLDTGESILPTFKVIDGGNITVISNYACNASVSILNANIRTEEVNFAQIDDEVISKYGTWSSEKIDNDFNTINTKLDEVDNDFNTINTKLDEALQFGVNAKDNVVQAINSKKTVPDVSSDNSWDELTQSIRNIKEGSGNAVASDVLAGKTFTNNDGVEYTGTMVNRGGATTVTPKTSNQTKAAGYYSGAITIKGDSNLVASNILSGKSIFGVKGNVVAGTRWARGTGTYTNVPHASGSKRYVARVSGLSFAPKYVIVSSTASKDITLGLSSSAQFTDEYSKNIMYYMKSAVYTSGSSYTLSGDSAVYYMKNGTFSMMIRNDEDKAYAFEWIAFEG